jgi:metal-responsive CopG/Arc/MetJ family transcriptional regulator
MKQKMKVITTYLEPGQIDALDKMSKKKKGERKSDLIRLAITEFLDKRKPPKRDVTIL